MQLGNGAANALKQLRGIKQSSTSLAVAATRTIIHTCQLARHLPSLLYMFRGCSVCMCAYSQSISRHSPVCILSQENEKLKKELMDKTFRIDAQNSKISELLQQSQMFVAEHVHDLSWFRFSLQYLVASNLTFGWLGGTVVRASSDLWWRELHSPLSHIARQQLWASC